MTQIRMAQPLPPIPRSRWTSRRGWFRVWIASYVLWLIGWPIFVANMWNSNILGDLFTPYIDGGLSRSESLVFLIIWALTPLLFYAAGAGINWIKQGFDRS
jgi:hypothetical protein